MFSTYYLMNNYIFNIPYNNHLEFQVFNAVKTGSAHLLDIEDFFFSSRRRHTRSLCDWSSDVCSSYAPGRMGCSGCGGCSTMETSRLNIAVVGVGYWGKNLLRTFARLATARVTHLCDLDPGRQAALKAEHPALSVTGDYAALLARPDVAAVVLATPPSRHHAMALAALRAGKHVWVEKPLALTAADGRELVAAARAAGRVLFVDETF